MATLATQPVTGAGLDLAHAAAAAGGDKFTPGAHVLLHVVNTGTSPVTVTVPVQTALLGTHVADVVVTVPAGARAFAGPFPAPFFAHPSDGLGRITYSDAAHTQVAAVDLNHAGRVNRGTIVTTNAPSPTDLPSGSLWATSDGDMYVTASATPPAVGEPITSGSSEPTDLAPGSVYVQVIDGTAVALFLAGGVSAADLLIVPSAPSDLADGQIAFVVDAAGVPSDMYVGGLG
jgi:hypothetical protein